MKLKRSTLVFVLLIALVVPTHISLAPPMPFRMVAKTPVLSAPSRSLGDCQEERLRLTRGCEHESDPSRPFAYVDSAVWYESRVARRSASRATCNGRIGVVSMTDFSSRSARLDLHVMSLLYAR